MAERLALLVLALVMLAVVACGAKESADPNPAADFFRLIYWDDTSFNPGPTNSSSAVTTILKPVLQSLLAVFVGSNELGGAPERLAAFAEAVHGA